MALRSPDLAPGRIEPLRTPFERNRQGRIEAVKIGQEIASGRAWGREQRVQHNGLTVQAKVAPLRFEFGDGQPPIHAAARRAVPRRSGPVGQFAQNPLASCALSNRKGVRSSTSARLASTVCRNAPAAASIEEWR